LIQRREAIADLLLIAALLVRLVLRQLLERWSFPMAFGVYMGAFLVLLPALAWANRWRWAEAGLARGDLAGSLRAAIAVSPLVALDAAITAWQLTGRIALAPPGLILMALLNGLFTAALPEEVLFRGFLWERLRRAGASPRAATLAQAALFAAGHLRYGFAGQWFLLCSVAAYGLAFGWMAARYRTLFAPIALHTLGNTLTFAMLGGAIQRL